MRCRLSQAGEVGISRFAKASPIYVKILLSKQDIIAWFTRRNFSGLLYPLSCLFFMDSAKENLLLVAMLVWAKKGGGAGRGKMEGEERRSLCLS